MLPILQMRQEQKETLLDFSKRVKLEAFKLNIKSEDSIVKIFQHGLLDKRISKVFKILKPTTLSEALGMVKEEDCDNSDENNYELYKMNKSVSIAELLQENQKLKTEIKFLKDEIFKLKNNRLSDNVKSDKLKCFRCNKVGYIKRFCKAIICYECGGNHKKTNCPNLKSVKLLQETELSEFQNSDSISEVSRDNERQINSMAKTKPLKKPDLVDQYVSYINGTTTKPKRPLYKEALLKNQPLANKPIVQCSVRNSKINVMFDTGADLNVVSENFAKQLSQRENIKIYPSETKVKCAND